MQQRLTTQNILLPGMLTIALALALFACAPKQAVVLPDAASSTAPSVAQEPPLEPYAERTLRTRSNIRDEPSTTSQIVATLPAGRSVGLLEIENGWYNIVADTVTGWVWAPLMNMTNADRWEATISYSLSEPENDSLFIAKYSKDRIMVIVLDMSWRNLSDTRKLAVVSSTGEAWRRGCGRMGLDPAPEIRFMSNNEVQMAKWHPFWGPEVKH
jgi:hypothetical protein